MRMAKKEWYTGAANSSAGIAVRSEQWPKKLCADAHVGTCLQDSGLILPLQLMFDANQLAAESASHTTAGPDASCFILFIASSLRSAPS